MRSSRLEYRKLLIYETWLAVTRRIFIAAANALLQICKSTWIEPAKIIIGLLFLKVDSGIELFLQRIDLIQSRRSLILQRRHLLTCRKQALERDIDGLF